MFRSSTKHKEAGAEEIRARRQYDRREIGDTRVKIQQLDQAPNKEQAADEGDAVDSQ